MKKRRILITVIGLAAMSLICPAYGQEQTVAAGWASAAPTMDGKLDAGEWKEAARINFDGSDAIRPGMVGPDSGTIGGPYKNGFQSPKDSSVIMYLMNDADFLYIAIDATDDVLDFAQPNLWQNDAAEIRIDGNMSRLTAKEGDINGFSANIRGDGGASENFPAGAESGAAVKADGSGWVIEYKTPIAGYKPVIGYDIAIDDSDDPANTSRDTQYRWNGAVDGGWNDETQWGALILATVPNPGPMLKIAAGALTKIIPILDGKLDKDEWAQATKISFDSSDAVRPGVVGPDSGTIGGPNGDGFQFFEDSHVDAFIMNDGTYLYVAIDAGDDVLDFKQANLWQNDAAEIRIDGNYSRLTAKEGSNLGFSTNIRGDGGGVENLQTGASSAAAPKLDGKGWALEFKTPLAGFKPTIGFDIAIDDSDDPANSSRDTQYRWNGDVDGGWNDETQWGDVTLATVPPPGPKQRAKSGLAATPPALDGLLDANEWKNAAVIQFDGSNSTRPGVVGPDSGTIGGANKDGIQTAADSSVKVYLMNDAKFLYIAIDATDDVLDFAQPNLWQNDAAEIRIDGNMSRLTAKEGDINGFSANIRGDGGAKENLPASAESAAAAKANGKGWIIEYKTPIAGYLPVIGFDIAIDDSDDPANTSRDTQYRWNGDVDGGWNDETQWGELILALVPGPQQKAKAGLAARAPKIDGTLATNEWKDATILAFDGTDNIRPGVVGPDSGTVGGYFKNGYQTPQDSSVKVYVMNDAQNLYVAIDAIDDILDFSKNDVWRNDAVEIRVDGNFSRLATKEGDIWGHSIVIRGDGGAVASQPTGDIQTAGKAKADGSGWVVEFRQAIAGFKPLIGFDISIDDADDPAVQDRNSQYRWNGEVDGGWNDETQWGELTLSITPTPVDMWELY
ncbi:MAG: sugar-binding protein [Candidatus Omnitrophota bacterium]